MIPDDVVERVREEADIISIVGEFVKLKRVGNSYRGPCPFHHGKNPNFSVTARGGYKCFRCGESGDVFTFVQKHLGVDFVEAVKLVGAKSGVEVHEVARRAEERDAREPLWEINATAADFFREQLWNSPGGQVARDYLAARGIGRDDADRFSIGHAPRAQAAMRDYLTGLGFDDSRQLGAGLLLTSDGRPEPRARFRDRLIFPIHDGAGRTAGFGGRVLGAGQPKYLNSSESEAFSKGKLLYGLDLAKQSIRKADRLFIVEGYFDVIRMVLAGIDEVVAPLGTALTELQAALISKYTKNVFLVYDSDQAGLEATFRAGDALLSSGVAVRVVTLPEGEDPDTFITAHGAAGFERAIGESVDLFDRKIQILARRGWFADLGRKRHALDKLLPTIRVTADPLTRDLYVARTCEVAGVSREMLVRELAAPARDRRGRTTDRHREQDEPVPPPPPPPDGEGRVRRGERRQNHLGRGVLAERELVRMLLHQRRFVESIGERLEPATFVDLAYRQIFVALVTHGPDVTLGELGEALDEDATDVLQQLLAETGGVERSDALVSGSVNALLSRSIATELDNLDRLLPLARDEDKLELIRKKTQLAAEMHALGRPRWKGFGSTSH
jgi:DNA primase